MPNKATIESTQSLRDGEGDASRRVGVGRRLSSARPAGIDRDHEEQMAKAVEAHLEQREADDAADRRNGYYQRHLLTELGDIELNVPRTRRYSPVEVIRAYARRTPEIDRVILSAFVLGLSTRKVGETLLAILGRPISAETVSQVAKTLDVAVAAFHRRPLQNRYQVLMLDGVVLARKTGADVREGEGIVTTVAEHDAHKTHVQALFNQCLRRSL
jgi:transposase-like protein